MLSFAVHGPLLAHEPWIDVVFRHQDDKIVTLNQAPDPLPLPPPSGEAIEAETDAAGNLALYGGGSGPVLEIDDPKILEFLKQDRFLIEFEFKPEKLPSIANPASLVVAGNRNSPGNAFGVAIAGPDELLIVRYAQGEWRSDRMTLKSPLVLFEWTRLAIAVQAKGDAVLSVTAFINGEKVGNIESEYPLGHAGNDHWLLVGGSSAPSRSLVGLLRSFRITPDLEAPLPSTAETLKQAEAQPVKPQIETRKGADVSSDRWREELYPYRVEILLDQPVSGKAEVHIDLSALEAALASVCPDPVTWQAFAFERCVLGTTEGGALRGGFKLVPEAQNLVRNSALRQGVDGGLTGWSGSLEPVKFRPESVISGKAVPSIEIEAETLINRFLSQPLRLDEGSYYLLSGLIRQEPIGDGSIQLQLVNPAKRLSLESHRSYRKPFVLDSDWRRVTTLHRPDFSHAELRVFTGAGKGALADVSLRRCRWAIFGDFPNATQKFYLYYTPRAGHRLPDPDDSLMAGDAIPPVQAVARQLTAEANPALRSGVRQDRDGLTLWQVPFDWPLRDGYLETVMPSSATTTPLRVVLPRGGREVVVLAVNTGTPDVEIAASSSDLNVDVNFRRISPISVYDGPHPAGKLIQNRYDAMTPLDYSLAPRVQEFQKGVHLIAVTLSASESARAGSAKGNLKLSITPKGDRAGKGGASTEFMIPAELTVKNAVVKPMRHFLTSFGGQLISFKYRKSGNLTEDQVSVADYHGVSNVRAQQGLALGASVSTDPSEAQSQAAVLAEKYFNRMLDSNLNPQQLMLFHAVSYDIRPNGEGKAPTLDNWDFSTYNKPIQKYALERDAQWLSLAHTNGANIAQFRLKNGAVYGIRTPEKPPAGWNLLPEDEFTRLVGDYYDAIAKNLAEQGVLDRAVIVVDESASSTYEDIALFVRALRQRPYAKQIRIAHTTYTPGLFKIRNKQGELVMDEAIDIPIPDNDEHFNFFEPEYMEVWKRPKLTMAYHVSTDHMDLLNAGVSTALIPLKFERLGLKGWYCWASFVWSLPYPVRGPEFNGEEFTSGPVINPWINPFYHHGPGILSWFYPPDPRGIPSEFTDTIIPSYRLDLFGDGIQTRAVLEILEAGRDDAGVSLTPNKALLLEARQDLATLWPDNPVQWYPNPLAYRKIRANLLDALP